MAIYRTWMNDVLATFIGKNVINI